MSPITRRWQRDLDQAEREKDARLLEMLREQSMCTSHAMGMHEKVPRKKCPRCREDRAAQWQKEKPTAPIVIGSKVRRIDEPYVVLRVREIDPEGLIDGTPKALCTNLYAHGKWMAIKDLEVVT